MRNHTCIPVHGNLGVRLKPFDRLGGLRAVPAVNHQGWLGAEIVQPFLELSRLIRGLRNFPGHFRTDIPAYRSPDNVEEFSTPRQAIVAAIYEARDRADVVPVRKFV